MININPDKNNPLLAGCRVMREYSRFVEETRKHRGNKKALEQAVQECIAEGIQADYLSRKGGEVVSMLMTEYDYDMDIAVQREESRELGRTEGIELMKEALKLHAQGKTVKEIAKILELPVEQVQMMLS